MSEIELMSDVAFWIIEYNKSNKNTLLYTIHNKNIDEIALDRVIRELEKRDFRVNKLIDKRYDSVRDIVIKW